MTATQPTDGLHDALATFGVATLVALAFDESRNTMFASAIAEAANTYLAGRAESGGSPRVLRELAQRYGIDPADHGDNRPALTFGSDVTPDQRESVQLARDEMHDTTRDQCRGTADLIVAQHAYIDALATYAGVYEH